MKVQKNGFRADEINAAMQSMQQDGLIEGSPSSAHLKITEAGFAAL